MADTTLTIGAPSRSFSSFLQWGDSDLGAIPAALMAGGITDARLRQLRVFSSGRVGFRAARGAGTGGTTGPDLTTAWETFNEAIVLKAGGLRLGLPGPAAAGVTSSDPTEPYDYNVGTQAGIAAFITAYRNLSAGQRNATTVTLTDERVLDPIEAVFAGVGGSLFAGPVNRRPNIDATFAGVGGSMFAGPANRREHIDAIFPGVGGSMFAGPILPPYEIRALFQGVAGSLFSAPVNRKEALSVLFEGVAGSLFASPHIAPFEIRGFFAGLGGDMLAEIDALSPPLPPPPPQPPETGRHAVVDAGGRIAVIQWEGRAIFHQAPRRIIAIYRGDRQIWPATD